jgi:hypothetical protein
VLRKMSHSAMGIMDGDDPLPSGAWGRIEDTYYRATVRAHA